jgi:hypothetical protein
MRPFQHMCDAAAWMAKAPPHPVPQATIQASNVIRFPIERTQLRRR